MYTNETQHYADQCGARQSGICLSLVPINYASQLVPFLKYLWHLTPFLEAVMREVRLATQFLYSMKKFHDQLKECQFPPKQVTWRYFRFTMYICPTRHRQSVAFSALSSNPVRDAFCSRNALWRLWSCSVFICSPAVLHKSEMIRYFLGNCDSERAQRYKSRKSEPEF